MKQINTAEFMDISGLPGRTGAELYNFTERKWKLALSFNKGFQLYL